MNMGDCKVKTYDEMIDYVARKSVHDAEPIDKDLLDRHEIARCSDEACGFLLAVALGYGVDLCAVILDYEDACDFHQMKKQEVWHKN